MAEVLGPVETLRAAAAGLRAPLSAINMKVAPGAAEPLAAWLDDAAREAGEIGPNHRAVEFARVLLGVPDGQ